jgi:hypothetical protein
MSKALAYFRRLRWLVLVGTAVAGSMVAVLLGAGSASSAGNNTITLSYFLASFDGKGTTNYTAQATNSNGDPIQFTWSLTLGTRGCGSGVGPAVVTGQATAGVQTAQYGYDHSDCPDAIAGAATITLSMQDINFGQQGFACTVVYSQGALDNDNPPVGQNNPPTTSTNCGGSTTTSTSSSTTSTSSSSTTSTTTTTTSTSSGPTSAKVSRRTKRFAKHTASMSFATGGVAAIGGLLTSQPPPVQLSLVGVGSTLTAAGNTEIKIADDPPDPDFRTIANAVTRPLFHVRAGHGVSRRLARSLNAMAANAGKTRGYGKAFATSVNRAAGAFKANNLPLARRQLAAADHFARLLAAALKADPGMRANVVSALGASAHNRMSVSAPRMSALKKRIATSGIPARVARTLGAFGLSHAFIMHVGHTVRDAGKKGISTTVGGLMNAPSINKGERNVANGLLQYASTH